jgi:hypothetical protein
MENKVKVSNTYQLGDQRVEVLLSNGKSFTVFVDEDTGSVRLLANDDIGQDFFPNKGLFVKVDYYGHPYED